MGDVFAQALQPLHDSQTVSVTNSSAQTTLPVPTSNEDTTVQFYNSGSAACYGTFGTNPTATVAAGFPLPATSVVTYRRAPTDTKVALISGTSSTVIMTCGTGVSG